MTENAVILDVNSLESVQSCINEDPSLLTTSNRFELNRFLLHIVCWKSNSIEVIEFILKQNPSAIHHRDENLSLPIHFLAQRGVLDAIQILINALSPDEIQVQLSSINIWGFSPLLYALQVRDAELIQLLFDLCPRMIQHAAKPKSDASQSIFDQIPLAALMDLNSSFKVIHHILHRTFDLFGTEWLTPEDIYYLLTHSLFQERTAIGIERYKVTPYYAIFDLLIQTNPDWLYLRNAAGYSIFHYAIDNLPHESMKHIAEVGFTIKRVEWLRNMLRRRSDGPSIVMSAAIRQVETLKYVLELVETAIADADISITNEIIDGVIGQIQDGRNILHFASRHSTVLLALEAINRFGGYKSMWSVLGASKYMTHLSYVLRFGEFRLKTVKFLARFGSPWTVSKSYILYNRGIAKWRDYVLALDPNFKLTFGDENPNEFRVSEERIYDLRQKIYFRHSFTSLLLFFC